MESARPTRIKAVIFDMDGVITNTMPYHFDAWLEVFRREGVRVNCYDIYEREGQDGLTSVKEILRQHRRKFTLRQARAILRRKETLFKRIVRIKFVKGARPFVNLLKQRGIPMALVTGTSRQEVKRILPPRLLEKFGVSVTGDEVSRGKPHPEPFLKAVRLLGVSRRDTVVLENAPFGIKAAKRAGLFCIALQTSLPRRYLAQADRIFKSYTGLRRYLLCFTGFIFGCIII